MTLGLKRLYQKLTVDALAAAGLTGATAASRYVGATASGTPASGTFAVGDFVIDQTGTIWVCTTAGSPGTWTGMPVALAGAVGLSGWSTWAPTWTNFTVGDGTLTLARYMQVGKLVVGRLKFTLGSTSAVTGNIKFSLPVTISTTSYPNTEIGAVMHIDASPAAVYRGWLDNTGACRVLKTDSTYLTDAAASSTVPFTWTTSDIISAHFAYEAA